ncbi:HEPN domain-containing protein [archaeon]|nr:HEPN domain-containing protein [Nanoarchaeota archaeon]MBU4452229.1 HEPN domain-containing protein [Nanoarchaeota archaeon]MCG2723656.1 HEPN domain-containing protein [archaeon]
MKNKAPDWQIWITDEMACKEWLDEYSRKRALRAETRTPKDFIKKAEHNLSFSNWLIDKHNDEIPKIFGKEENFYDWAISAFYYSIYHAAMALLAKLGVSSKSHSATLCAVIYYYYHKSMNLTKNDVALLGKCLGEEDIESFVRTKALRERANYGVSRGFEIMLAEEAKKYAETFVNKVKEIINLQ